MKRNPYYICFGRIPTQYISRSIITDTIIETLECEQVDEQAFKLTGIRGMSKTVALTEIEKKTRENEDWIVVDLKADSSITEDLVADLYSKVPFITDYVNKELNLSRDVAEEMAAITMGYPFAYQALGKFMWDEGSLVITDKVLAYLDDALAEKVYKKIWSELASADRFYMEFISQKYRMEVNELLMLTGKKHNEWSEPRRRLKEKGIIDVSERGVVKCRLPRLFEFIQNITRY